MCRVWVRFLTQKCAVSIYIERYIDKYFNFIYFKIMEQIKHFVIIIIFGICIKIFIYIIAGKVYLSMIVNIT